MNDFGCVGYKFDSRDHQNHLEITFRKVILRLIPFWLKVCKMGQQHLVLSVISDGVVLKYSVNFTFCHKCNSTKNPRYICDKNNVNATFIMQQICVSSCSAHILLSRSFTYLQEQISCTKIAQCYRNHEISCKIAFRKAILKITLSC